MSKVNICGVSEYKFTHDGWCHECKNHCEIIPEVLIDNNKTNPVHLCAG